MPLRDSHFRRRCSSVHMSSSVSWLKKVPLPSPSVPSLSHPNNVDDVVQCNVPAEAIASVKKEIAVLSRKRKRGNYGHYDEVTRAKIVKYAISNSGMKRKFSKELEKPLNESTVRGIKNSYLKGTSRRGQENVNKLHADVLCCLATNLTPKFNRWCVKFV